MKSIRDRMLDMFVLPEDQPKVLELWAQGRDDEIDQYIKGDCIIDDYSDHKRCSCNECDGYGHKKTNLGYMHCPNQFTIKNRYFVLRNMDQYNNDIDSFITCPMVRLDSDQCKLTPILKELIVFRNSILSGEKKGLILCGNNGCGKTFPSSCLGYEVVEQGHQVLPVYFPDFVELHRNYEKRRDLERMLKRIDNSFLLIVDELGRNPQYGNKEFFHLSIENIVKRCYKKRNLIITTNLNKEQLSETLNTRCIDLLSKNSKYCKTLEDFETKSLRVL